MNNPTSQEIRETVEKLNSLFRGLDVTAGKFGRYEITMRAALKKDALAASERLNEAPNVHFVSDAGWGYFWNLGFNKDIKLGRFIVEEIK